MNVTRYVPMICVKTQTGDLLPINDQSIVYNKNDDYGHSVTIGNGIEEFNLIEAIYDIKKKVIVEGIVIDIYPLLSSLRCNVGDEVFYEISNKTLISTKIVDILYDKYDVNIRKGDKIESWQLKFCPDVVIDPKAIYKLKTFKPTYVLDSGHRTDHDFQLFKLQFPKKSD